MMIYGVQTCALCQMSRRALEAEGQDFSFRDVRAEPLNDAGLSVLIEDSGIGSWTAHRMTTERSMTG